MLLAHIGETVTCISLMLACRKCLFDDPRVARRPQRKETFGNYCTTFCTRASACSFGRRGRRPSFVAFQRPYPLLCDLLRFSRESEKLPTCKEGARCKNAGERGLSVRPSSVRSSARRLSVRLSASPPCASGPPSPPRPNNVMNRAAAASSGRHSLSSLWRGAKLLAG